MQEGRRAGRGSVRGRLRGQADVAVDTALPPGPSRRSDRGRAAGRAQSPGPYKGHGGRLRPHRRRDGMSDRLRGGRAHRLRHVQSGEPTGCRGH